MRERVAGYISKQKTRVPEKLSVRPSTSEYAASPYANGVTVDGVIQPLRDYNAVIPDGSIGSAEGADRMEPPPQRVETAPYYRGEQNDPSYHGAVQSIRSGASGVPEFHSYDEFIPRSAPLPRAAQDEAYLDPESGLNPDPLILAEDSDKVLLKNDDRDRLDLYGPNRDGVLKPRAARPGPSR